MGLLGTLSRSFFMLSDGPDGAPRIYNILAFGLPGLNNLFYTFINPTDPGEMPKFLQTVAISLLVALMMIAGFLATGRGRGMFMKFLLAIAFAVAWFALYNNAEFSIYGGDFWYMVRTRFTEIPIATVALLCLIPWTGSRATRWTFVGTPTNVRLGLFVSRRGRRRPRWVDASCRSRRVDVLDRPWRGQVRVRVAALLGHRG